MRRFGASIVLVGACALTGVAPVHAFAADATAVPTASSAAAAVTAPATPDALIATAKKYIGYPYAYIGDDPTTGFSCIGYVHFVYGKSGVTVPEELTSAYASAPHVDQASLQPGDLVFFQNTVWSGISHVDIYIGNGKMIGADSFQTGVQWDTLSDKYWQEHYLGATRPLSNPSGTLLEPTSTPVPASPTIVATSVPSLTVTVGQTVNPPTATAVYSGPGGSYTVVDTVGSGTALTIVQVQGNWINVSYNGGAQYGWVGGSVFGQPGAPPPSVTAVSTAIPTPVVTAVTVAHAKGTRLQVHAVQGLRATKAPKGRTLTVTASILYVRAAPSTHARILRRVRVGDRLTLLHRQHAWCFIAQRGGARGWVSALWVKAAS